MLILTRRIGDTIVVIDAKTGEEICEVTVLEIRGRQARLGLEDKREGVIFHRQEVWQRILREAGSSIDKLKGILWQKLKDIELKNRRKY